MNLVIFIETEWIQGGRDEILGPKNTDSEQKDFFASNNKLILQEVTCILKATSNTLISNTLKPE